MENGQLSRRELIKAGLVTGAGGALGFALAACTTPTPGASAQQTAASPSPAGSSAGDIAILNGAIDLENQAIWAYTTAAGTGKLNGTDAVSMAVLALAKQNMADHQAHAQALSAAVTSLGGTPSQAKSSYDLSSYINNGEGNLNDLASIARLALALEVDACLAYESAFQNLSSKALLQAAGTIAPDESAHAAGIRALLIQAGAIKGQIIPASFVSASTRAQWVVKM